MASAQPKHTRSSARKSRAQVVKPGRLPVTEFAFDRAGAASPFGDDVTFPLPVESLAMPVESKVFNRLQSE